MPSIRSRVIRGFLVLAFVWLLASQHNVMAQALPPCPEANGDIGDWRWKASVGGAVLTPQGISVTAGGDVGTGTVRINGRPGHWMLEMDLSRPPVNNITLVGKSRAATLKWTISRSSVQPPMGTNKSWFIVTDVTQVLDSKAGLAHDPAMIVFNFLDGNRSMAKLEISTKGFNDVVAKSDAATKAITGLVASKRCDPQAEREDAFD